MSDGQPTLVDAMGYPIGAIHLPNVYEVSVLGIEEDVATPYGVYVWPGCRMVTLYTGDGMTEGTIVPLEEIRRMRFGASPG